MPDLSSVQKKIVDFRNERDRAQFHDPKNLAEALSIEAGKLLATISAFMALLDILLLKLLQLSYIVTIYYNRQ